MKIFPMKSLTKDKSYLTILALLLISGIISWNLYFKQYIQRDTVSIHVFPTQIGEWTSRELPITDDEYAILETRNAFVREYTNISGDIVHLFIVYSQNNRKVSHPPEICYTGGGVEITGNVKDSITVESQNLIISGNRLTLEGRGEKQFAFYWFKVGDSFTSNYWKQQILIAIKTLFARPASSALIRVSASIVDDDQKKAAANIKQFSKIITPLLFKYLP